MAHHRYKPTDNVHIMDNVSAARLVVGLSRLGNLDSDRQSIRKNRLAATGKSRQ
jgi:hypothetical protein